MPEHHPAEEMLLGFAAGGLAEPMALIVAAHLALCPACRSHAAQLEALGGALLTAIAPEPVAADAFDRLAARLDAAARERHGADEPFAADPSSRGGQAEEGRLPPPLSHYAGPRLRDLPWERRASYLHVVPILRENRDYRTRIIRIQAGRAIPLHTHPGLAYSLVLEGAYSAADGRYRQGDFAAVSPHWRHSPTADADQDCICLGVAEHSPRFVGPLGPIRNLTLEV